MYIVYVIQSADRKHLYIGTTSDLERRIKEHNSGRRRFTSGKGPWNIVRREEFSNREHAFRRERFLKTGHGRLALKNVLGS
jgi:putative endonuclease